VKTHAPGTDPEDKGLERKDFSKGWIGKVSYPIFHYRKPLLWLFIAITIVLGWSATRLQVSAGFSKMIPMKHEYMLTFQEYADTFGGANKILVSMKTRKGDIYSKEFIEALRKLTEEVFYIKGVERSSVTSLVTANVRYTEVVEDGFKGDVLVPSNFAGTPEQIALVRANTAKSDWIGRIVANDYNSAMVVATLQEADPETGKQLDLKEIGHKLEEIRAKYETGDYTVNIIGFAKAISDIADGAEHVLWFFALAFVITCLLLYWYSGSLMLTSYAIICAVVPVIWLLGLMPLLGLALDPMSILVPFLIFSIAVSHAVQMTNGWKLETLAGHDGVTASRLCFEKLFVPGAIALLANALGFVVIAFVQIKMVQELTITATLGVTVMIITNKMLLPILLSYRHFSASAAKKLHGRETLGHGLWRRLGVLAERKTAAIAIAIGIVATVAGLWIAKDLKVGDLGHGVPELRANARYNKDVDAITKSYAIGVDLLQVIAVGNKDSEGPCVERPVMDKLEEFDLQMKQTDGVASIRSLAGFVKQATQNFAETFIKWRALPEDKAQIAQGVAVATRAGNEFMSSGCKAMAISIFTSDHQATTIDNIVAKIKEFKAAGGDDDRVTFKLASGNVGVMAATNEVVHAADKWVNLALFASVSLLCLVMFRSWRVTLCIILPLALVTLLCNAVMALLGIGVKVNTLPVVALGVGVGVDYGIYLFESMTHALKEHPEMTLRQAFVDALKQRGTASVFTAVTMTISVATWSMSALKFQADMGILLAFMFLVNMLGAILLLPALAAYLYADRNNRVNADGRKAARSAKHAAKLAKAAATSVLVAIVAAGALFPADARAVMTAAEVERLSTDLTPVGAVRGASADGSIPAWTGGLTSLPSGWTPDKGYVDPFAADKLLFTISAANMAQYAGKLTPGMAALLKAHPNTLRMNVYPTRRTAAYPKHVTDLVARFASTAVLQGGVIKNFGDSSVPFPMPRNGEEAIWNHLVRYQGGAFDIQYDRAVVKPGEDVSTARIGFRAIWDYNLDPRPRERELVTSLRIIEPAIYSGTIRVVLEPIGFVRSERDAFMFTTSQKRLRKEANADYDAEAIAVGGLRVIDQYDGFNGAPDRYDWILTGKKEIYVPYNAYRLGDKSVKLTQLLGKYSVNPDLLRYELHRVWVVDGTVKGGFRHVYPRRTFYLDEDSWAILYEDAYDTRGNLWRVAMHPLMQLYDVPTPFYRAHVHHDLNNGGYVVEGIDTESKVPWRFGFKGKLSDWTPEAIMEASSKR
jgi:predicted RND superfamily exporter protein